MLLEDIKVDLEKGDIVYHGVCHDCGTTVEVKVSKEKGKIAICGGSVYKVKQRQGKRIFFKCDECFKKDKTLRNFRQCEVYSRVVGYLGPVNQWNKGKLAEWNARKEFTNTKGQ